MWAIIGTPFFFLFGQFHIFFLLAKKKKKKERKRTCYWVLDFQGASSHYLLLGKVSKQDAISSCNLL
jgi:lipid-A-disaccharide synthase-like uncharacterized protein